MNPRSITARALVILVACSVAICAVSGCDSERENQNTLGLPEIKPPESSSVFTAADPSVTYEAEDADGMNRRVVINYKKDASIVSMISMHYTLGPGSDGQATDNQISLMKSQIKQWKEQYGSLSCAQFYDRTDSASFPNVEVSFKNLDDPGNAKDFVGNDTGLLNKDGLIDKETMLDGLEQMGLTPTLEMD